MSRSFVLSTKLTPGELFSRARAAEARTGIGRRRMLCSERIFRLAEQMPHSCVPGGAEFGIVGY